MSAPTITIRFDGDVKQLEQKTKAAADTINRNAGGIGKGVDHQRAFSGLQDRFKKLVGIGKKSGDDTGEQFNQGLAAKVKSGAGKRGTLLKGGLLGIGAKLGLDFAAEFSSAFTGASDLQQSVGGLEAVFKGASFGELDAKAKGAARSLGLSRNSYNELATTLGAGLKNKGITDFASQTQNLIGLGADLAAQFGGSTEEAVSAISSLMRGEADPIERYGIAINETAVNAELAARGQTKLTGAALEQAKAQARVDVLMRQSADAQGAFARESDTLAGKQQRDGAIWEDLKTKIGSAFLPTLTNAMGFLTDTALPTIEGFVGKAGPALGGLFDLVVKGDFTTALREAFGVEEDHPVVVWILRARETVLGVTDEISGAIPAFGASWAAFDGDITSSGLAGWFEDLAFRIRGGFEGIRDALANMWAVVQPIALEVWSYLTEKWAEIQPKVAEIFGTISAIISEAMIVIQAIIQRVTEVISIIWSVWGENIQRAIGNAINMVVGIFQGFFTTVKGIWQTLAGILTGDWSKARDGLVSITEGLSKVVGSIFTGIKDNAINTFDSMVAGIGAAWDAIKGVVAKPINVVIGYINDGLIGAYNWVAEKVGLGKIGEIPELKTGSSSGRGSRGGRGSAVALAGGGFVRLPWDPANRDPYLGMTPRGAFRFEGEEFFVKRSSTAKLERTNPGLLDYLNRFGQLPGHAEGGMTTFKGHRFSMLFAGMLREAERRAGASMDISQGGYRPRTSYSGTSHQADAVDIVGAYHRFIAPLRSLGVPTWDRAGKGPWRDHAHGIPLAGSGYPGGSAVWQGQDYLRGGDGLGGRDNGPRGGAIDQAVKWLGAAISAGFDTVKGWFDAIVKKIEGATFSSGGGMFGDLVDKLADKLKTGLTDWVKDKLGYAAGARTAAGGLQWAGERGPELIDFDGRERVYTLAQLRAGRQAIGSGPDVDLDELIGRLVLALTARPQQVTVSIDEGDIRRIVKSELRSGK